LWIAISPKLENFSEIWFQITNSPCSDIRLPKFWLKISIKFGEIAIYKSGQLMSINWSILIRGCAQGRSAVKNFYWLFFDIFTLFAPQYTCFFVGQDNNKAGTVKVWDEGIENNLQRKLLNAPCLQSKDVNWIEVRPNFHRRNLNFCLGLHNCRLFCCTFFQYSLQRASPSNALPCNKDNNFITLVPTLGLYVGFCIRGMQLQLQLYRNLPFSTLMYNYLQLLWQFF
jgi:hypothetical protein